MDNLLLQVALIANMCGRCFLYENVALFKPTFQSSEYKKASYPSDLAVDGIRDTDINNHGCTHTGTDENPWWTVNLEQIYLLYSIKITNRGDSNCGIPCADRLAGVQVHVSSNKDIDRYEKLVYMNNQTSSLPLVIDVTFSPPLRAQYVTVSLPRVSLLTLCEVEVYGELEGVNTFSSISNAISTESLFPSDAPAGQVDLNSPLDSTIEKLAVTKTAKDATDKMVMSTVENVLNTSPSIFKMISPTENQVKPTIAFELTESTIEDHVYLDMSTAASDPYPGSRTDLLPSMWSTTDPRPSLRTQSETAQPKNVGFSTATQLVHYVMSEPITESLPVHPLKVKLQSVTVYNYCPCKKARNSTVALSILADLNIDKKHLSRMRSRYVCAPDDRTSAHLAGLVSMSLIGLILVGIILSDISKIMSDIIGNGNHKGRIKQ